MKRLIVASISGFLCGLICFGLASRGTGDFPFPVILQIVASRTLIGVAIGISCVRLGHWSIHGLVMGLLFSIPLAFSGLMAPENPPVQQNRHIHKHADHGNGIRVLCRTGYVAGFQGQERMIMRLLPNAAAKESGDR